MKKIYLIIAVIFVLVAVSVYGCGTTTIIQQVPNNVYTPPPTSTTIYYPPAITTIAKSPPNQGINPTDAMVLPSTSSGVNVQAGRTLSLSWSADGSLNCYIVTANQYNNFVNSNRINISYFQKGVANQGSISYTVQNSDTYLAVLVNNADPLFGGSVEVYQATLTEH